MSTCKTCSGTALLCPGCMSGQWVVETASGSFYLIDLDAMTQVRTPDPALVDGVPEQPVEVLPAGEAVATLRLRRDDEPVPLISLSPVREGRYMEMLLNVVDDGVTGTWRMTNLVVSVRPAN